MLANGGEGASSLATLFHAAPFCTGSPTGTLLVKHGVQILENIKTEELAADKAYEFFFVLAAPRFKGSYKALCTP